MADLQMIAVSTTEKLQEISKQAMQLGTALQNAAPASGSPSHSIQYLFATSDALKKIADECAKLGPIHRLQP